MARVRYLTKKCTEMVVKWPTYYFVLFISDNCQGLKLSTFVKQLQQNHVNTNSLLPTHSTSANSLDPNSATENSAVQNSTSVNSAIANSTVANSAVVNSVPPISTIANPISTISMADQDQKLSISANSISHKGPFWQYFVLCHILGSTWKGNCHASDQLLTKGPILCLVFFPWAGQDTKPPL